MCGIIAIWDGTLSQSERERLAAELDETIVHRGPDGAGHWSDTACPLTLAHRRLAIRGLGQQGAQPMISPDGKSALSFNGELFEIESLRDELRGSETAFCGTSDTEVLLHALVRWGMPGALDRIAGQFAFVWYDGRQRCLFAARDRVGVRPLFFAQQGLRFAAGSEQKALLPLGWVDRGFRRHALLRYLALTRTDDIPLETMIAGIQSLPAGHWMRWDGRELIIRRYHRIDDRPAPTTVECVRRELERAISSQLVSDVPVGAMVSGGLDSSAVTMLADRARLGSGAKEPLHLFAYHDALAQVDERPFQRAILEAVRSPKVIHWVSSTPHELREGIEQYVHHQEEPYGDVSSYAEYCIARKASKLGVKVLLGGLGGDEVFLGYPSFIGPLMLDLLRTHEFRTALALLDVASAVLGAKRRDRRLPVMAAAYHALPVDLRNALTALRAALQIQLRPEHCASLARDAAARWHAQDGSTPGNAALRGCIESWTIPMFLAHSDRMCLAHGVESRVPLLDDGVIRAAFGTPAASRISSRGLKAVLRTAVSDILPPSVRDRAWKASFHAPLPHYVAVLEDALRSGHEMTESELRTGRAWNELSAAAQWRAGMLGLYMQWVRSRRIASPSTTLDTSYGRLRASSSV